MNYTVDATNKSLGRLASEVAKLLMGKNTTSFARNVVPNAMVTVTNAAKLNITQKRRDEKEYKSYSGHPGGLKIETMDHVINRKGVKAVIETAVKGMLPDNKLKKEMMKHLTINE